MQTHATSENNKSSSAVAMRNNKPQPFFAPAFIQPKLTIGPVDDPYEKEADSMAEQVMRMPQKNGQKQTFFKPAISTVQRKCKECEKEEKLQMKAVNNTNAGTIAPSAVHDVIKSGGAPLDAGTRDFMESRFDYDFSNVQIHNDSLAHQSSANINAKAYTYGNHIAFANGKFQPNTNDGKQLLAHELTHVIQQGYLIRRDIGDDPDVDFIGILNETKNTIEEEESSESDSGIIAKKKRQTLLLDAWIDKLIESSDDFMNSKKTDIDYASDLIIATEKESEDESGTITELISLRNLSITPQAFLQDPFFNKNINAFPKSTLQIIIPLIGPAQEEVSYIQSDEVQSESVLQNYNKTMPPFLFEKGLPLDLNTSKTINDYEVIDAKVLRTSFFAFLNRPPDSRSDFNFLFSPEGKQSDNDHFFSDYHYNWANFFENAYNVSLVSNWINYSNLLKNNIEDGTINKINIPSFLHFQTQHPKGIELQEFKHFTDASVTGSYSPEFDPFAFVSVTKTVALLSAALHTQQFVQAEHEHFATYLFEADAQIQQLSGYDRYTKAVGWGIDKGFFAITLDDMVNKLPGQLEDVLKDMAIRIGVEVGVKLLSGIALSNPFTAALYILYQGWKLFTKYEDTKAILEIIGLIEEAISIIDEAQSAFNVVGVQRSAARLTEIPQRLIPALIIQLGILGSQIAAKKIGAFASKPGGAPDPIKAPVISSVLPGEPKILVNDPKLPGDTPKPPLPVPHVSGEPKILADPHAEPKNAEPDPAVKAAIPVYGTLPAGAIPGKASGDYIIYKTASGQERIRFKAESALTLREANSGRNYTTEAKAGLNEDGVPFVHEGRHRAIGAAHGDNIPAKLGGVPDAPGWLDFKFDPDVTEEKGVHVKDLTIDYTEPDVPPDEADKIWEKRHGNKTPVTTFLKPDQATGEGYLTPAEVAELQAIATTFKTKLYVVGSRAKGQGRNINRTDLPAGKDEAGVTTRSDIDVRIDSEVDIATSGGLSDAIANVSKGAGKSMNLIGKEATPPAIIFEPR